MTIGIAQFRAARYLRLDMLLAQPFLNPPAEAEAGKAGGGGPG